MTAPRLLVPDVSAAGSPVQLTADEAHHLVRVLRARAGDEVRLFDGRGREWVGRLTACAGHTTTVVVLHETTPVPEPPTRITLAVGLLKGDQMDAVVREATMLGVAAIVPMVTAHVTVPARARQSGAARDRWTRVALASARQCGRATVPDIAGVQLLADVLAHPHLGAEASGLKQDGPIVMCVEPVLAGHAPAGILPATAPASALVLVGPEGGWAPGEVAEAASSGAAFLSLGPRTLRAESAPIVALTALWSRWGW
jgi:16S rRNA (uracil1498-N3)-methyltransferase